MRKMMEFTYHLADKKQVPVILDTDDKDKAARYVHLGMKLDRVRSCGERFHMYDLIREHTVAEGAGICDYWTVGDKVAEPK